MPMCCPWPARGVMSRLRDAYAARFDRRDFHNEVRQLKESSTFTLRWGGERVMPPDTGGDGEVP